MERAFERPVGALAATSPHRPHILSTSVHDDRGMDKPCVAPRQPSPPRRPRPTGAGPVLRGLLALDGAVFLMSALFNLGVRIPMGPVTLGFPSPIRQAAIGEIVIGSGLIVAARTARPSHALVAALAATLGIAFGLSSQAVVGPAREIHLLLVPLTALAFLDLAVTWATRPRPKVGEEHGKSATIGPSPVEGRALEPAALAVAVLMAIAAAAYASASLIHFGLVIPLGFAAIRDPFPGAAAPEGVIAIIMLAGAITAARRIDGAWLVALLGSAFTGLLTLYGLSITLRASRPGDVAYHLGVLGLVAVILALVLLPATRHALTNRQGRVAPRDRPAGDPQAEAPAVILAGGDPRRR